MEVKNLGVKITWQEPLDTGVISVEIYRSTDTKYGTYNLLDTINATSDGLSKSSTNTWVTSYTDSTGLRTYWYKIRFYDGTNYSDYSEPTTQEDLLQLCTVDDVKNIVDTVGRWSDNEVFTTIKEVDDMIYVEFGTPITAVWTSIGKISDEVQSRYYVGEKDIYRVDRVFYGTTELHLDDEYKTNNAYGMIEILPVASSGITLDTKYKLEIQYVPKLYHKLSLYRTCKSLLEKADYLSGGKTSKELQVIEKRLEEVEKILSNKVCLTTSSRHASYDPIYGVNLKHVRQDHERNAYVGGDSSRY